MLKLMGAAGTGAGSAGKGRRVTANGFGGGVVRCGAVAVVVAAGVGAVLGEVFSPLLVVVEVEVGSWEVGVAGASLALVVGAAAMSAFDGLDGNFGVFDPVSCFVGV